VAADGKLQVEGLSAYYGETRALTDISLAFPEHQATAIIGPSGCGKSTFIRCLNRLHETLPKTRVEGRILLDGDEIHAIDAMLVRRRIGMVFQKPNPFVSMSIYGNVSVAMRFNGHHKRAEVDQMVIRSLKQAALWDEVKDRIDAPAVSLSGGQQQRLCIARALAAGPEVLLMDEPCSALDPVATAKIESLVGELKKEYTVIIVTHNLQQATRVADRTAFLYLGKLVEVGETGELFERPKEKLTEQYITGRFG
jgi:phosphate transport system ATP-binding protein